MVKLVLTIIGLALILAACGDSPTPAAQAPAATVEVTRIVEVTKVVEVTKIVTVLITAPAPTPVPTTAAVATTRAPASITTAPAAASNNKGKVGDTLTVNGYKLTLSSAEKNESFGDFAKAKVGNILVAVDLTIASELDKGISVNPFYASIKDSEGFKYTSTFGGKEPSLASQNDLPKGDKVRGWLTFELPKTAKGLVLEYKPTDFVNNTVINFTLE